MPRNNRDRKDSLKEIKGKEKEIDPGNEHHHVDSAGKDNKGSHDSASKGNKKPAPAKQKK